MPDTVIIVDYDSNWASVFQDLKKLLTKSLGNLPATIEHIGSTAIPGAAAKPIIDIDVIVSSEADVQKVIHLLARAGYRHLGDLGIRGREAFENPNGLPVHHLYVVVSGNSEHVRHLLFRDYLRNHPEEVRRYSDLKKSLAVRFRNDREAYTDAKSDFVQEVLIKANAIHDMS